MSALDPELREKVRRQFDHCPYPSNSIDYTYADKPGFLYTHNLVTSYYRRHRQVTATAGKLILDAGCGSGVKALGLAQANPGARVIGVDISPESVELAKKRLQYHGFSDYEFHVLALEDLAQLGMAFDYINCDEVLYLLPDPVAGLQAMRSVLKPEGILRVNLHSLHGRRGMLQAQEAFQRMGLMESNPEETEIQIVKDTFAALRDDNLLKQLTDWKSIRESHDSILANCLLVGDRGFSIPQVFALLRQAELEFFSMVEWRKWDIYRLFKDPNNLPVFWELSLPETSVEDQLAMVELLNSRNRLIDLWCGHPQMLNLSKPLSDWSQSDWLLSTIHLHPQLKTEAVCQTLEICVTQLHSFEMGHFLPDVGEPTFIDSTMAACLLVPLMQGFMKFSDLVERWLALYPLNPITAEPTTREAAQEMIYNAVRSLEAGGYLLVTA
jgi:ubiquinone/menaquinone biosynthesis C-methylase UbiE